jgi:YD repeat-containing protein
MRPEIRQTVDRWGNVLAVNDARSLAWITRARYNADNHLIDRIAPQVRLATGETVAPSTHVYYDVLGRQVGTRDANGNLNRSLYNAGGELAVELHADGGMVRYGHDAFGNAVRQVDANGNVVEHDYDRLNRLTATRIAGTLVQSATYDDAGRAVAVANGAGETLRYRYDLRGNVVEVIQPMGQETRYAHDVHNRQTAITDALGRSATWTHDDFGLLLSHTDIGGASYVYRYDDARQLLEQSNSRGQHLVYGYDAAGRQVRIDDQATGKLTEYRVDALGNHLAERTTQNGEVLQDSHLAYDSNARLTRLIDTAAGLARIAIGYDAAGNRRRIATDVDALGANLHNVGWYAYDAMNRQTVVDAGDAQGSIATQGHRLAYDFNGNRISDTWHGSTLVDASDPSGGGS